MNKTRLRYLPLAATALLAGCLPAPYGSYYQPTIEGAVAATPIQGYCGGQTGPATGVAFELAPGLPVRAEVPQKGSDMLLWRMQGLAPGPLRFGPEPLRLNGQAVPLTLRAWASRSQPADALVDASSLAPSPTAAAATQLELQGRLQTRWEGPLPATLRLHWPAMQWQDGRSSTPPTQTLGASTVRGWVHYQSEAQLQQRQARHAQCLRETPQRQCGFILDDTSTGFGWQAAPAELQGRLFSTRPANGELQLHWSVTSATSVAQPSGGAWRWAQPNARLEDPATGRTLTLPLPPQRLTVTQAQLPLDSALVSRAEAPLSLMMELPLSPPAQAEYQVQWPALQRGDQAVKVPLLRLQRRTLDGGLLPFNC